MKRQMCEGARLSLGTRQGLMHDGAILDVEHCARDFQLSIAFEDKRQQASKFSSPSVQI
jgi:hypothetical protein